MKAIRFNKKLVLNKKTIVNLNNDEMSEAQGGATFLCTQWEPTCCSGISGTPRCNTAGTNCCVQCKPPIFPSRTQMEI
jgi:hypothetical protein